MKRTLLITSFLLVFFLLPNQSEAQSENESAILMINAIVNKENKAELPGYLSQMRKMFKENGGKPVGRYKMLRDLKGNDSPEMIAIISFENSETIENMINSEAYKALSELRSQVFTKLNLMVCEEI